MAKTALITGANAGLGRATAFALAEQGYRVILACRNQANAEQIAADITQRISHAVAVPWLLDLASLEQIRISTDALLHRFDRFDLLINNAGVFTPPLTRTEDGFELQFGVNHLGHFAFTLALKDLFSEHIRVINISSSAHRFARMRWDNLNAEQSYSRSQAYGQSKLANLLFTLGLQSRLPAPAMSIAVHPGYVATKLHDHLVVTKISNLFLALTPKQAVASVLMAALDDMTPGSYVGPAGILGIKGKPGVIKPGAAALDQQSAELDIHHAPDKLRDLCGAADVVITDLGNKALAAAGLAANVLRAEFPGLIYCHVSGFGHTGPLAHLPGYEHLVAAATGRMLLFQGTTDRAGPVFSALQVGIHATAQSSFTGILAALFRKQQHGCGGTVRTSLLQGMLPFEQGGTIGQQFPERFADRLPQTIPADAPTPTLFYHPMQAADGRWLQSDNLLPHLFDNFLMVADLVEVLADPDFDGKQLTMPEPKLNQFRFSMLSRIQSKPADEWMAEAIANGGVVAGKYQTSQAALTDPDIVANGHVIECQGGVQLGPIARLSETPADPGGACTATTTDHWATEQRDHEARDEPAELPLAGVKVLELATIIAAPMGASFLADLGAEVTKIEQVGGDPYRGFSFGIGSARVNAGKRSICLNLKSPAAQAMMHGLVKDTDILIHNYRPGVPEKLGFGYQTLAAINPELIYLQCNGYGPGAHRPCTHPIPGASMGGVMYQMGGSLPTELLEFDEHCKWASRIMRANEVNPDPNTALVVASAAMMGLTALARHGISQQIFVDMFGANAYANHDDFLDYAGKQPRALQDEGLHGLGPTYRLYACAEDQWLFLAIPQAKEQQRFCDTLRVHQIADLSVHDLTEEKLTKLFAAHSADAWQTWLQAEGVGAARADAHQPSRYWLDAEQAQALDLTYPASHPAWGDYRRHGANVTLDGVDWPLKPPPAAGQHSREILASVGYDDHTMDRLFQDGVVWQEDLL